MLSYFSNKQLICPVKFYCYSVHCSLQIINLGIQVYSVQCFYSAWQLPFERLHIHMLILEIVERRFIIQGSSQIWQKSVFVSHAGIFYIVIVWSIKAQPKQLKKAEKDVSGWPCKVSVDYILKSLFPVASSCLWEPARALLSRLGTCLASFLTAYCCYKHYPHMAAYICLPSPPLHMGPDTVRLHQWVFILFVDVLCASLKSNSFACLPCVAAFLGFFLCITPVSLFLMSLFVAPRGSLLQT